MRLRAPFFSTLILSISLLSCQKDATTELDSDWLFPIAKGALSINSVSSLSNLKYSIGIPAQSISQPVNIPVSSPGLNLRFVGPFPVRITDWLKRLDIDSLGFSGSLNNFFPIPIGAGTQVVMRTSRDTSSSANIAGTAVIANTVAPGGLFSFDIDVRNKSISDSVFFFLENFSSPAYSNVTFSTTSTRLDITLKVITASYIEIYTGKTFTSNDTTEFSAGGDGVDTRTGGGLNDSVASGFINVFAENGLPAHASIQLYFLNPAKTQILDSLFLSSGFLAAGGRTDGAGNPSFVAATAAKVTVSRLKLDNIRNAGFVASRFQFNTVGYPGAFVSANRNPNLSIQLTGDLKLSIRF